MLALLLSTAHAHAAPDDACATAPVRKLVRRADGPTADRVVAAAALLDGYPACAEPSVESWMTDPAAADLAAIVAARLDTLPEELAVTAATLGMRGPHALLVQPAVWDSARARIRAVLSFDVEATSGGL